jgi:SAM-dependent methyltransferase
MNKDDIEKYLERYNDRLEKYGFAPESLGWGGGRERQNLRFEVLSEIGIKNGDSVLDVGCGFADLYNYLKECGWEGNYFGVDINGNLLDVAKNVYPEVNVRKLDILESVEELRFDWVVSSGIFNAKLSFENNFDYIKRMLERMVDISVKGVFSDFMSIYVDYQHPDAYHTPHNDLIDFLRRDLNKKFVLRMDYLPFEYCIYIKK